MDQKHAALGSFLGACVGDAAGGILEFIGRRPTRHEVSKAMAMSGGGFWRLAPGQCTDDGELALCLARSLAPSGLFDADRVAQDYQSWCASDPFDIGGTIGAAFCPRLRLEGHAGVAAAMRAVAQRKSAESKANGSLMRCVPLAILGWTFSDQQLAELAWSDSSLSHPNPACCDAVACYIQGLASLIQHPGDSRRAFKRALTWANNHAVPEVVDWLIGAAKGQRVAGHPHAGFVKIAFIHAFYHLFANTSFEKALQETLELGGDTDTNACIVCGLVGARVGLDGIPDSMYKIVLDCDTSLGRQRPDWLHPRQIPHLVTRLLEHTSATQET